MKVFKKKSDFCCEVLAENINKFMWYSHILNKKKILIMPVIPTTHLRVNHCFSCGAEIRDIQVDPKLVNYNI